MKRGSRALRSQVSIGNIGDAEAYARSILDGALPPGMFLRPDEYDDELQEILTQLVDWYRPVDPLRCGVCGNKRGEQHEWNCDALPPQRVRRSECLDCGTIRIPDEIPVHADDCRLVGEQERLDELGLDPRSKQPAWGCHTCGRKRGERHLETCDHRHERQQRYDPAQTDSFSLFARFRLTNYYVPDLCRRLLGRNGGRIAERSHAEVDERADLGRRPWDAAPEDSGDLLRRGARDREGVEAGGVGEETWGRTVRAFRSAGRAALGARPAPRHLPDAF